MKGEQSWCLRLLLTTVAILAANGPRKAQVAGGT